MTFEQQMGQIKELFREITEGSMTEKKDIVARCFRSENEQEAFFANIIRMYLDTIFVMHIGEKSLDSDVPPGDKGYADVIEMMTALNNLKAASNNEIAMVKRTLADIADDDVRAFARKFITKTFKLGMTAGSVNKAVGRHVIPTFSCMLANRYFDHKEAAIGHTLYVTEKMDGIRCICIISVDEKYGLKSRFYSRQGQPITGLVDQEHMLKLFFRRACKDSNEKFSRYRNGLVFDGELLISNRKNVPSKVQYKRTVSIVRSNTDCKDGITYNIFDILPLEDFQNGYCATPYSERREHLDLADSWFFGDAVKITPIITKIDKDEKEPLDETMIALSNYAMSICWEGVMLNLGDAPYECKRTNSLLKVKVFQDCDLKITGFQRGTNKYANTLGALIVDYKGNPVGVGSGFTDDERDMIWNNQSEYFGRVVTVQYFEETYDASGKKSIRFPVFVDLREEGKEVSYN